MAQASSAWARVGSPYQLWNTNRRNPFAPVAPVAPVQSQPMATAAAAPKKVPESLFGPNIGVVNTGPAWTENTDKKLVADELSQDVVQGWIEKSKEPAQPTTTLQALVNLQRRSLRLSPLHPIEDTEAQEHPHPQHGLEFEYDCDAPHVGIYINVILDANHPEADTGARDPGLSKTLVYETVVPGGFGSVLKLEQGASLELTRFDAVKPESTAVDNPQDASTAPTPAAVVPAPTSVMPSRRRRFTNFHFRRRSVTGPALAVVDDAATAAAESTTKKDDDSGVRISIRLAALDEQKSELASPNEQTTYLHVVRYGAAPADGEEDVRPWVVKVVKREACIGAHTFQLHEIYGLSSANSAPSQVAPAAAVPIDPVTYPPTAEAPQATQHEDEASTECLLCLSSPREVVLLPCRHLVACKDCALNMVEFGSGGVITHNENDAAEVGAGGDVIAPVPPVDGAAAEAAIPQPTPASRRRKRARGYFCILCRQPYTSLLRITTSAPDVPEDKAEEIAVPAAAAAAEPATPTRGLGSFTPAFLRGLSRGASTSAASPEASEAVSPAAAVAATPVATPVPIPAADTPAPAPVAATSTPVPAPVAAPAATRTLPPDLERGLGA